MVVVAGVLSAAVILIGDGVSLNTPFAERSMMKMSEPFRLGFRQILTSLAILALVPSS
jgi:hypothetical protein